MDNMSLPPNLPPHDSLLPPNLPPQFNKQESYHVLSEPNRVRTGEGLAWLKEGLSITLGNIWKFIGALLLLFFIAFILQLIPKIGSIIYWLFSAIFNAGFAYMFHQKVTGKPVKIRQLFAGFRQNMGQLVLIAVWTGLAILGILLVLWGLTSLMGGWDSFHIGKQMSRDAIFSWRLWIVILVGLLLYFPLMMAQWISPTLVILHGIKATQAMRLSFKACLYNMLPLLVLGLIILLIGLVASIAVTLGIGLLFISLKWFVAMVLCMVALEGVFILILMASNYVAYRSVMTNQPLT